MYFRIALPFMDRWGHYEVLESIQTPTRIATWSRFSLTSTLVCQLQSSHIQTWFSVNFHASKKRGKLFLKYAITSPSILWYKRAINLNNFQFSKANYWRLFNWNELTSNELKYYSSILFRVQRKIYKGGEINLLYNMVVA